MIPLPFTLEAISYTWRQLARRAGVSFSQEAMTGFEDLGIPVFYGTPEHANFSVPGLVIRRCANTSWDAVSSASENSLCWKQVRETIPTGGSVPFSANIPVLFWGEGCEDGSMPFTERRKDGTIVFNADILSASFFMLSRLEEVASKTRDEHGRFPVTASVAYCQKFLDIPLVDQYALILREWIKILKPSWKPISSRLKIKLSHDIDWTLRYSGAKTYARAIGGALIKERSLSNAWKHAAFVKRLASPKQDPYYRSIYELGQISTQFGLTSAFYFMAAKPNAAQSGYDPASPYIKDCFRDLRKSGHVIGFHPGYSTYNNLDELIIEKKTLEAALGEPVLEGRQHYLRFQAPNTWRLWEEAGLSRDSSMGFAEHEGFRCGTCWSYAPFDVEQNREIKLQEIPLTVMDATIRNYRKMTPVEGKKKILQIANRCAEVGGTFTMLWHNSSLNFEWSAWKQIYIEVLQDLTSSNQNNKMQQAF